MYKWQRANNSMSEILSDKLTFSSTTEELFGERMYSQLYKVVVHSFRQVNESVEVAAEFRFIGEGGVIEFVNVMIG